VDPRVIGAKGPERRSLRVPSLGAVAATAPAVLLVAAVIFLPLGLLFRMIFAAGGAEAVARVLESGLHRTVMLRTVSLSTVVALICLFLGYPVALFLRVADPPMRRALVLALALPMTMSVLIRSYAWMAVLGRTGLVNTALLGLGVVDGPFDLLFNRTSVTIGMVSIMLPIMIFPLYSVMEQIDTSLLEAARSAGASALRAIFSVVVPLSVPGVAAGVILVFILCLGFYVTPALLGGPREQLLAQLIETDVRTLLDWQAAAVSAILLTVVAVVSLALTLRLFTAGHLLEEW